MVGDSSGFIGENNVIDLFVFEKKVDFVVSDTEHPSDIAHRVGFSEHTKTVWVCVVSQRVLWIGH